MTAYRILDTLEHREHSVCLGSVDVPELSFGMIGHCLPCFPSRSEDFKAYSYAAASLVKAIRVSSLGEVLGTLLGALL